jgi:acyl-CoA synthetase (AMP-forming)/AMP-acid ligase II/thioesterase domain-containing protein
VGESIGVAVSSTEQGRTETGLTAGEVVEHQVDRTPDGVAVADTDGELTYAQLDRLANRVAHAIVQADPEHRCTVGAVLVDHSRDAVIAQLAISKAGRTIMTLGPTAPADRVAALCGQAGAVVAVAAAAYRHLVPEGVPAVCIDDLPAGLPTSRLAVTATPEDAMTIVFTSGSTGRPKGAMRSHKSRLMSVTRHRVEEVWGPGDRVAVVFEYTSAAASGAIWPALGTGASANIRDVHALGAKGLATWISEQRITRLSAPAALVEAMLDDDPPTGVFQDLQVVTFTGDVLHTATVRRLLPHLTPDACIKNVYGSSEMGRVSELVIGHGTVLEGELVSSGRVRDIVDLRILDPDERGVGELQVSSHMLSTGYLDASTDAESAFTTDPDDPDKHWFRSGDLGRVLPGRVLELHGRLDDRVKIRAQTIDPAEVELALLRLPEVREASVAARPLGKDGGLRLVAYVAPAEGADPTTSSIRRGLRNLIPGGMIPQAVVVLDALPRTVRGKVDRAALPLPPAGRPELDAPYAAPATLLEQQVVSAFEQVLEIDGVGRHDDFFDLGGDSLLAVAVTVLAGTAGYEVPLSLFVDDATPAAIAAGVEALTAGDSTHDGRIVALQTDGGGLPIYGVHAGAGRILNQVSFAARTAGTSPWYGIQMHESEKARDLYRVAHLARRYADDLDQRAPTGEIGPCIIAGYSYGALVAHALAAELARRGRPVAACLLIDPLSPGRRERSPRTWASRKAALLALHALTGLNPGLDRVAAQRMAVSGRGARWYRGTPLPVPVVLFQAELEAATDLDAWRPLAGAGLEVIDVPGSHSTMVDVPNANVLGDRIAEAADRINVAAAPSGAH